MYCNLGQNQFFDDAGAPLSAGRVKIFAKGSDTMLPIYEDNGDGFVPAQNPVITANDGRIPTVFWPAALVDVVVEKSNGDGTYTELDSYVAGLDLASVEAVQGVGSITELRSIMPSENMVVQVNGYYTAGDSPTRKYLWVAGAANTDDGGYIIASNVDAGGRWLMLWDDSEFLPVSLYGIMCGYSGYSKNSNIPALESLGHYVIVGSVRVEVPPVILFDWRMAQPTSGQSSPIAYHWSGTLTTTHYVACASGVVFSTTGNPTIHCAGVRGESFTTAYWLVDQDYTRNDPIEKISTLMFRGNTQAMHDAFMACVGCSKVALVELSKDGTVTTLYDLLDSSDGFQGKMVLDYSGNQTPAFNTNGCMYFNFASSSFKAYGLKFANLSDYDEHLQIGLLGGSLMIRADSDVDTLFDGDFRVGGTSKAEVFEGPIFRFDSSTPGMSKDSAREVPMVHGLSVATYGKPINIGTNPSSNLGYPVINISSALDMTDITSDDYTAGDVVLVLNTTASGINVFYGISSDKKTAVLNPYQGCLFYCVYSGASNSQWAQCAPA